jgi:hypothetical protein
MSVIRIGTLWPGLPLTGAVVANEIGGTTGIVVRNSG